MIKRNELIKEQMKYLGLEGLITVINGQGETDEVIEALRSVRNIMKTRPLVTNSIELIRVIKQKRPVKLEE